MFHIRSRVGVETYVNATHVYKSRENPKTFLFLFMLPVGIRLFRRMTATPLPLSLSLTRLSRLGRLSWKGVVALLALSSLWSRLGRLQRYHFSFGIRCVFHLPVVCPVNHQLSLMRTERRHCITILYVESIIKQGLIEQAKYSRCNLDVHF
jgi:hypothetical protein